MGNSAAWKNGRRTVAISGSRAALIAAFLWSANGALAQHSHTGPCQDFARDRIASPDTLTGVIALGGGVDRIREAGRLARQFPHIRVVVSGDDPQRIPALLGPGIDRRRVWIENASRNTHENAVNTTELVKPASGERWLLITSDFHMPRALCSFLKAGFPVEPWPIADGPATKDERDLMSRRERFALRAYQMLGWCDAP
jgi:uncharacterized SAM-binding protein YcdF (DUF218 family)